jgi:apolipoprotein N-acyltransferase
VNLALAVSSAVLLILIFPRFDWPWLAPVALTPLVIACARERSWKRRFLDGWLSGFVFWFGVCYWIQFVLEVHGGMGRWGGWGAFVLFAALKGLHTALFASLAGLVTGKPWAIPAVAALWTGIEHVHGHMGLAWIGLGFTWMDLGNAGIDVPVLLRLAPHTGVYGLSFVYASLGTAVALVALRRPRLWLAPLAALVVLLFLPPLPDAVQGGERVQVVQPNVNTEATFTGETLDLLERRMAVLSRAPDVRFIVWPEAPAPFYPSNPPFLEYVRGIARDSKTNLLFGGVAFTAQQAPLNSAFLIDAEGRMVDRYDKIHLVPFGEYVPPAFGWVNRITQEAGDFVAGERVVTFPIDGHRTGAFICYESAFPDLVRQFAAGGAELLINLSNDGYFGRTAAREQHLAIVRMRAAENRRWILRATNDGITAMIDPAGRIAERLTPYQQIGATMRYNYVNSLTPYTRLGDWFAWICLAAGAGAALHAGLTGPQRSGILRA